jgi:CSLREA domain-containing protein
LITVALGVLVLLAFVPAISSAAQIVVNTTSDNLPVEGSEVCGGGAEEECTLRDAIEKANGTLEKDNITFGPLTAGAILRVDKFRLPPIYHPVSIEGDTAQGATEGTPALEIAPFEFSSGTEFEQGLVVQAGEGTRIEGLAIGGFGTGIELGGEEDISPSKTEICGDSLGTELDGIHPAANGVGIEVGGGEEETEWSTGTVIGRGTQACEGNVISGNNGWGIVDQGRETTIAGNAIGLGPQPNGENLPNVSGGILEMERASHGMIGGVGPEAGFFGNVITNNEGPGVLVESGASDISIRHNYISGNEGLGIEIATAAPETPTITAAYSQAQREFWVKGTVTGTVGEEVQLEFFGNATCDSSGAGEGATYLGGGTQGIGASPSAYEFLIPVEVPRDDRAITATVTRESGATSQFSTCATYEPPPTTFVVTTLGDSEGGGCGATCSLREALEVADESKALDTIDFAESAEGTIKPHTNLPTITEPVDIDGTSAPGYAGRPLVMIDGTEAVSRSGGEGGLELIEGLVTAGEGGGSVIQGLAIGGYEYGVYFNAPGGSRLCASWVGVALDGQALANTKVGVEPGQASSGSQIGVGCPSGAAPNVISGNGEWGISDVGELSEIGGNEIGVGPDGEVMPNGGEVEGGPGGGIRLVSEGDGYESREPVIGGIGGAVAPNTIAYNDGAGVLVQSGSSRPEIRGNSIYGNEGRGIAYEVEAPTTPKISSVSGQSGALTVSGGVTPGDDTEMELDFYASAMCSPLSAGVGETYLGTKTIAVTPSTAKNFTEGIATPISDDELYITVTATGTAGTTEFSECVARPAPKHEEAPPPPSNGSPLPPQTKAFIPVNGEKVVVKPEEGRVKIKLPGTKKFVVLTELKEIPVGAVIDATNGRVKLTSISPDGTEQTAEFFGGVFRVKQKEGSGLVVLELLDTTACPAPKKANGSSNKKGKGKKTAPRAAASSVSYRPKGGGTAGKLWGSGHGNFRTEGHDGSATVEGTIWLVEDRCNGSTFFRTRRGIVKVRDFVKHKSLPLPAGKTYLAGEE